MSEFAPLSSVRRLLGRTPVTPHSGTVGRFELLRMLGKGAQSTVWLAFDPRLEREVALKLMRPVAGDASASLESWLREARHVGRVAHPCIVPVFEADVHEHQPYIVFEHVAGRTLELHLAQQGPLAPHAAVSLLLDILDGLQAAHAAGVVHRDLKPSNVMVDAVGRARVMDFGTAAAVQKQASMVDTIAAGTPAYMSPEAASGAAPAPSMDVFSAGLVLAELLGGKPLVSQKDVHQAIYRVAHGAMPLPRSVVDATDDKLRSIVLRALARDPAERYDSAQAMRLALQSWTESATATPSDAVTSPSTQDSTLDFLLRRMRHKSDFPALSDSVSRIQKVANSEDDSVADLTGEILKDVALTNKLLRMVNSVTYVHVSHGAISTVSRAVSLVGFNAVRTMALSLVLLDHMRDKAHASQLRDEFLRAMLAGSVAAELSVSKRESEEAFLGAMFQNLGRMLAEFYFPEEAQQIRSVVSAGKLAGGEDAAAVQVLGLHFEDLGVGVAKSWGLPETLLRCMRKPMGAPPMRPPEQGVEYLRWAARAANEIATTLLQADAVDIAPKMRQLAEQYNRTLDQQPEAIQAATERARLKLATLVDVLEMKIEPGTASARVLNLSIKSKPFEDPEDPLATHALRASEPENTADGDAVPDRRRATEVLAAGIQDITDVMVESFQLNDVLRMILETMFRALALNRIVFCLRDPKTEIVTGRFGLGQSSDLAVKALRVPLKTPNDLFAAVCLKGADTLIGNATEARMVERLPQWYRQSINAPAFLLLPMHIKGKPFGLIYADQDHPGGIALDDKELALLRTLRNQAVMAFRHAG